MYPRAGEDGSYRKQDVFLILCHDGPQDEGHCESQQSTPLPASPRKTTRTLTSCHCPLVPDVPNEQLQQQENRSQANECSENDSDFLTRPHLTSRSIFFKVTMVVGGRDGARVVSWGRQDSFGGRRSSQDGRTVVCRCTGGAQRCSRFALMLLFSGRG